MAASRSAPNVPVSSSSAVWIGTTIIATNAASRTIISEHRQRLRADDLPRLLVRRGDRSYLRLGRRLAPRGARQRVRHERDDGLRGRRGVRRDEHVGPRGTLAGRRGRRDDDGELDVAVRDEPPGGGRVGGATDLHLDALAGREAQLLGDGAAALHDRHVRRRQRVAVVDRRVVERRRARSAAASSTTMRPSRPASRRSLSRIARTRRALMTRRSGSSPRLRPGERDEDVGERRLARVQRAHAARPDELLQARRAARLAGREAQLAAVVEDDVDLGRRVVEAELQRARGVERDDPPVGEERDAIAQLVGLVHVVRRQEDRRAARGERRGRCRAGRARSAGRGRASARRGTARAGR